MKYVLATLILLSSSMVYAQALAPTDFEILQAEAKAAEAQAEYYAKLIRKQAATAKETAEYWAAYIGEKKNE